VAIDRSVGAQYAQRIIDLYAGIERELAEVIAGKLKRNLAHDDLSAKLLALTEVRRSAEAAMRKIDGKLGATIERALVDAAVAGGRKAQEDLLRVRDRRAVGRRLIDVDKNLINSPSVLRLAATLAPGLERRLAATHLQVVRSAGDIYQEALAATAGGVLAGVTTRREATQKALDHLWQRGITGFVDKAGRNWNLASYVEMSTRTTTAQAAIQAHLDQLSQQGMDLVMVSADGSPCPLCRPWEGKILATGAATGSQTVQRASELDGSIVSVHIDGSTSEAIGAGLFHPSCRHRFITYLPGLTAPIETAGEGGSTYAAEQRQRAMERKARKLAVQQAGAVDPAAARRYAAAYRAKRAEIAQHVKETPGLRRKTERERIDLGHTPSPPKPSSSPASPKPALRPKPSAPSRPAPRPKPNPVLKPPKRTAPAVAKPAGAPYAPALDSAPRLTDRENRGVNIIIDALGTNPEYPKPAYTVNCVHVVNAYELRARGYDVQATALPDMFRLNRGRNSQEALDRWVDRNGMPHGRLQEQLDTAEMLKRTEELPEGARGWVAVNWEGGGSHIFNVEKINGKVRFVDAQKNEPELDIYTYIKRSRGHDNPAAGYRSWRFMRVDDLEPTDAVMEFVKW